MPNIRQSRDEALARLRAAQRLGGCTRSALLGGPVREPLLNALIDPNTAKEYFGVRGVDFQKRWGLLVKLAGSRPASLGFVQVDGTLASLAKQFGTDQATLSRNLKAWGRRVPPAVVYEADRRKKPTLLLQIPLLTSWMLWVADARSFLQRGLQGFIGADMVRQVSVTLIALGLEPPPEKGLLPVDARRLTRLAQKA